MSKRQNKEQERARYAWDCVDKASRKSEDFRKRYGTLARNMAALIQVNGLGQTLAFVYSKAKLAEKPDKRSDKDHANEQIFYDLSKWVKKSLVKEEQKEDLLQIITRESSAFYQRATVEAMGLIIWLRRFAEGVLPTEEE
jgi:CRISPR-associated protein Cmr5